jgi:hypothetical protein
MSKPNKKPQKPHKKHAIITLETLRNLKMYYDKFNSFHQDPYKDNKNKISLK